MSEHRPASQNDVLAFLADPLTHGGRDVRRIDTHGAIVFLSGKNAFKVKRAVRFPFLDYSTLAKRKAACEEELKINSPFAPQIYRRAVPITQNADGHIEIDGDGTPIEWAVEMARFDETLTFDHIARSGPLASDLLTGIADTVLASHSAAPVAPADPWIASIPLIMSRTVTAFRSAGIFAAGDIDALDHASHAAFARVSKSLEQRGQFGFVRRCHGDLHLENIALIDGKPVLFDAIEFDAGIASVDVLYDLAFVLMDFIHYGRGDAANAILNRYIDKSPDTVDALQLLPLFMSMRAAIRAQVLLARLEQNRSDTDAIEKRARSYFDLARRLMSPSQPNLIAIGGLSGTGKSALARMLASTIAPLPGAVVVRSDVIRKRLFNADETHRLPADAYRPAVTAQVYEILAQSAARILDRGCSVIVDAVFARQSERTMISSVAQSMNRRFAGIFLTADLETRKERVAQRSNDASDATPEIAVRQEDYDLGEMTWSVVDASGTPEQTLARCQTMLSIQSGPDQVCST